MEAIVKTWLAVSGAVLDFIDQRKVVRRIMVLGVFWAMIDVYVWAKGYAATSGLTGVELGAVITAVMIPITALTGFIFKTYDQSRQQDMQ